MFCLDGEIWSANSSRNRMLKRAKTSVADLRGVRNFDHNFSYQKIWDVASFRIFSMFSRKENVKKRSIHDERRGCWFLISSERRIVDVRWKISRKSVTYSNWRMLARHFRLVAFILQLIEMSGYENEGFLRWNAIELPRLRLSWSGRRKARFSWDRSKWAPERSLKNDWGRAEQKQKNMLELSVMIGKIAMTAWNVKKCFFIRATRTSLQLMNQTSVCFFLRHLPRNVFAIFKREGWRDTRSFCFHAFMISRSVRSFLVRNATSKTKSKISPSQ